MNVKSGWNFWISRNLSVITRNSSQNDLSGRYLQEMQALPSTFIRQVLAAASETDRSHFWFLLHQASQPVCSLPIHYQQFSPSFRVVVTWPTVGGTADGGQLANTMPQQPTCRGLLIYIYNHRWQDSLSARPAITHAARTIHEKNRRARGVASVDNKDEL